MSGFKKAIVAAAAVLLLGTGGAQAAGIDVYVGYADGLRPSPYFPSPWDGSANTTFVGLGSGGSTDYDAGAIMFQNNTGGPVTFNSLTVDGFGDGASFSLWGGAANTVVPNGGYMIFTQTASYNFDSSDDEGGNPAAIPHVKLTIDGNYQDLADTAQVLNTEGTDHLAAAGLNESHQWRLIGTYGGQAGGLVPLPGAAVSGVVMLGLLAGSKLIRRATRRAATN